MSSSAMYMKEKSFIWLYLQVLNKSCLKHHRWAIYVTSDYKQKLGKKAIIDLLKERFKNVYTDWDLKQ